MVLIAENVCSWVISTWQKFNKEQYCQSCQTILVPDVAKRKSCHIKHIPMERLLSLFLSSSPSLCFFSRTNKSHASLLKILRRRI